MSNMQQNVIHGVVSANFVLGIAVMLLVTCGCSKPISQGWRTAKITVPWDFATHRPLDPESIIQINDSQEVTRLSSFFPGMAQGRKSRHARKSCLGVTIEFHDENKTAMVMTDYDFGTWSEGAGDWPLQPEFKDYFMELLKKHRASDANKPLSASPPVSDARPGN